MIAPDSVSETWVIVWFPPNGDKTKRFATEAKARAFAAEDQVAEWNPLMEKHQTVTTIELVML